MKTIDNIMREEGARYMEQLAIRRIEQQPDFRIAFDIMVRSERNNSRVETSGAITNLTSEISQEQSDIIIFRVSAALKDALLEVGILEAR